MPVRGVRDGDVLPTVELPGDDGEDKLPAIQISLAPAAMGPVSYTHLTLPTILLV